ncbi:MAG: inositol monophosphatase family protein [Anaerolineae bacterium]
MSEFLEFALETARRAGRLLCTQFTQRHTVSHKSSDIDLVTEADLASEQLIVEAIRARFPGHTILAEEGLGDLQQVAGETEWLWVVDPLDGTVNYAHGFPVWGVSLALAEWGQVQVGVTYDSLRDDLFWAERGGGAWRNGARIHVSDTARLRDALVATGFAYKRATLTDNNLAEFSAIMPRVQGVRRAGAAVIDLALLAAGVLDGYWEMHLQPWDWAAGWLLIEEAGGMVTDLRGRPWSLGTDNLAASNGALHDELLAALRTA